MQTQFVFELPPEKRSILVSYGPYRNEYWMSEDRVRESML